MALKERREGGRESKNSKSRWVRALKFCKDKEEGEEEEGERESKNSKSKWVGALKFCKNEEEEEEEEGGSPKIANLNGLGH